MTPEQKQRIEQIRERRARMYFPSGEATKEWADIDFLLSALADSARSHIEIAVDKAVELGATSMRSRCVEAFKSYAAATGVSRFGRLAVNADGAIKVLESVSIQPRDEFITRCVCGIPSRTGLCEHLQEQEAKQS